MIVFLTAIILFLWLNSMWPWWMAAPLAFVYHVVLKILIEMVRVVGRAQEGRDVTREIRPVSIQARPTESVPSQAAHPRSSAQSSDGRVVPVHVVWGLARNDLVEGSAKLHPSFMTLPHWVGTDVRVLWAAVLSARWAPANPSLPFGDTDLVLRVDTSDSDQWAIHSSRPEREKLRILSEMRLLAARDGAVSVSFSGDAAQAVVKIGLLTPDPWLESRP